MKNIISTGLIVLAMYSGSSNAVTFDGSQPLLCASAKVIECLPVEGCHPVEPRWIAAPALMKLDFSAKKMFVPGTSGEGKSSSIEHVKTIDGKLILQGAEDGVEDVRDGVGWSIAISQDTGRMVLTASGDDMAITIFGTCTAYQ